MLRWWTVVKWWHKAGASHTRQPLVSKHLLSLPVYEYPDSEKLHWVHGWVTSRTFWTACAFFKRVHWYLFESGLPRLQHSTPIWLYVRREPHTRGALSNGEQQKGDETIGLTPNRILFQSWWGQLGVIGTLSKQHFFKEKGSSQITFVITVLWLGHVVKVSLYANAHLMKWIRYERISYELYTVYNSHCNLI